MSLRVAMLIALPLLFAAPAIARSQTTDEARALAGANLPPPETPRPVPAGTVAQTTDEARALAGRSLPQAQPAEPRMIQAVGTTDEARAVAGGTVKVAPAAREAKVAKCGASCDCGNHG